jgi:hypothetical protein
VNIDKPGQDDKAAAVDLFAAGGGGNVADRRDRSTGEGKIDVAAVDMTARCLVPGDEPSGPANDARLFGHGLPLGAAL